MAKLIWDKDGERLFETGVDRGVLFTTDASGIAWNGLTSVKEASSGGEASPYFLDGLKYLNIPGREDFSGTIEAYTYPDEFAIHDGTYIFASGIIATQQRRRPFGLSYRTKLGNDINGQDNAYKLHIIYNALAEPSEKSYSSVGDTPDPSTFSWNFTTTPRKPVTTKKLAPLAHVIIDSRKTASWLLAYIEEQLYGSLNVPAHLIPMDALFKLFENPQYVISIFPNTTTGLSQLVVETQYKGDLFGQRSEGLYKAIQTSRLVATSTAGLYRLGT